MKRLRLVKLVIQPVIVIDDGEHLLDAGAQPFEVPSARLGSLVEEIRERLSLAEAELNVEPADAE